MLSLISLLRWFFAFIDRTEDGAVEAGLWAVRNPAGLAADARRVAVWMTRFAARLERGERRAARRSELPEPHLVVSVDGPHPHSHVGRRRSRSAPEAAASR